NSGSLLTSDTANEEPLHENAGAQSVKQVEVQEALPPAGVIGRREGARIQWMQLPKAARDWQPSTETRIWHGSAKGND
ncbi:MAG: hypothetical protein SO010_00745, partial [Candidatus Limiplasma sp.]|nr:hypothetical protein [Candidatus Limiplasma sp.]